METYGHATPFTIDNCTGYTQDEMDALNAEFEARWNGWGIEEALLFLDMDEDEATKQFQAEVARR